MKSDSSPRMGTTVVTMVLLTLGAKALGMLRQMMTAAVFAASAEGIAFAAASRIPLAVFDMLFSTAILGSFLPIYRGRLLSGEKRAREFSSAFFTVILAVTCISALLGVCLARPVLRLAAPSLTCETLTLAVRLLRIMFPSMIFAGAAYILIGILQSHESFLLPASVSAVSNLISIAYLTVFAPHTNTKAAVYGLAVVYTLSWAAQFLTLAVPLLLKHRMPRLCRVSKAQDLADAGRRALPVMFGAWLIPAVTLTANAAATYVSGGAAVVFFENAFSVFSIAGGLMTYGVCNYLFPKLAARFSEGDREGFARSAGIGLIVSLMISLPIAAALFILADETVCLLFVRGNYTAELAVGTAAALRVLCLAMPAYGVIEFLCRVSYSCAKVLRPTIASAVGILTAIVPAWILRLSNRHSLVSVTCCAAAALLAAATVHLILSRRLLTSPLAVAVAVLGTALSCTVMVPLRTLLKKILQNNGAFQNFITIALVFAAGIVVYLIWIFLFRRRLKKWLSAYSGNHAAVK